jgi:hypothetical protein
VPDLSRKDEWDEIINRNIQEEQEVHSRFEQNNLDGLTNVEIEPRFFFDDLM